MTTPYPPHPLSPAPPSRTNGLAIATLVLGICGFALIPIILGHIALAQIRARHQGGGGMAIAGLVLGYLTLAGYAVLVVVLVASVTGGIVWGGR